MTRDWLRVEHQKQAATHDAYRVTNRQKVVARRDLEWIWTCSKARLVFRYDISDLLSCNWNQDWMDTVSKVLEGHSDVAVLYHTKDSYITFPDVVHESGTYGMPYETRLRMYQGTGDEITGQQPRPGRNGWKGIQQDQPGANIVMLHIRRLLWLTHSQKPEYIVLWNLSVILHVSGYNICSLLVLAPQYLVPVPSECILNPGHLPQLSYVHEVSLLLQSVGPTNNSLIGPSKNSFLVKGHTQTSLYHVHTVFNAF